MLATIHNRISRAVSEQTAALLYAVIIGVGGGFGAVGFRRLIDLFTYLFYHQSQVGLASYHGPRTWFIPALGGLLVGCVVFFFAREAKGHGVPEVMYAVTEKQGVLRSRVVLAKALASALSIGSGGSVGREGPIVQIASAWGSSVGQLLGVNGKLLKTLVACGAAAGIAGTFNAPIGGALFACEIILVNFAISNISAIVVSSVLSAAIGRYYLGNVPSFPIPHYEVTGIKILLLFAVLGLISGLFSLVYIRVLLLFELAWDSVKRVPEWVKPAVGGVVVGCVAFFYPQIMGVGYPTVEKALANHLSLGLLAVLLVLKLLMTCTTIASGGSGGVFAPGLFMGSMLGGAYGLVCVALFPHLTISDGVFAVVGMSAVFAGTSHAPITAMIMLFEMTDNYQLILPLMLATVISATLSTKLHRESIYTMKLMKRGYDIIRKRSSDRLSAITVEEALHPEQLTLSTGMTLAEAWASFEQSPEYFAAVRDPQLRLVGSVAKAHILQELQKGHGAAPLTSLLPEELRTIDANATLREASFKMKRYGVGYLIAVGESHQPVGIIGNADIVRAYNEE